MSQKRHKCITCGRAFVHKHHLRRHEKKHSDPSAFTCQICGYQLHRADQLRRHTQRKHPDAVHKCQTCSFSTRNYHAFQRHQSDCVLAIAAQHETDSKVNWQKKPSSDVVDADGGMGPSSDANDHGDTSSLRAANVTTRASRRAGEVVNAKVWDQASPASEGELPPLCSTSKLQEVLMQTQPQDAQPLPVPSAPRPRTSVAAALAREQFHNATQQAWQNVADAAGARGTLSSSPLDATATVSLGTTQNAPLHVQSVMCSVSLPANQGPTLSSLSTTPVASLFHQSLCRYGPVLQAIPATAPAPCIPGALPLAPSAIAMTNGLRMPLDMQQIPPQPDPTLPLPIPPAPISHFITPYQTMPRFQALGGGINPLTQQFPLSGLGPFPMTSLSRTATFPMLTTTAAYRAENMAPVKQTQLH